MGKKTIPPTAVKSNAPVDKFSFTLLPIRSVMTALWVLTFLGFFLYLNTTSNEFALDDGMVILENRYTKEGFGGFKKILTSDSFEGIFGDNASILAGGRYRPLSLLTFAAEYQFYGEKASFAAISHGWNAVIYALCIFFSGFWLFNCFKFFDERVKYLPEIVFLSVFIFAIHPIHTEAVANLKGRDELLCFLFSILTLIFTFKGMSKKSGNTLWLVGGGISFFLALLSKENAVTFLGIIPLSIWFFHPKKDLPSLAKITGLYFAVFAVYFALRFNIIGFSFDQKSKDVLNQPFALASTGEALATKIYLLNKYLSLLFLPYPLSFDYSYNQIPYKSFGDFQVWLSLAIHLSLIILFFFLFKKKHVFAYCIAFYLMSISIVSNLIINIGAFLGERFLFQASLGFALFAGYAFMQGIIKLPENVRKPVLFGLLGLLFITAGGWTFKRNKHWKNNDTLFLTDVKTVPSSSKAQKGAGEVLIKQVDNLPADDPNRKPMIKEAIEYYTRALQIHPKYSDALLDIGAAHYRLENWDLAEKFWLQAQKTEPEHPILRSHFNLFAAKQLEMAFNAYSVRQDMNETIRLSEKSLSYNPQNADAYYVKGMAKGRLKQFDEAVHCFSEAVKLNPSKQDYVFNLAGVAFEAGKFDIAATYFEKTLQLNPQNESAKRGLAAARAKSGTR